MANPTTNYGWPMPISTDLVTDLPADFAAFGQPVDTTLKALNPETTLGDIAYRSATSNTNTRLGIGTNGQVLAVSGGVPAWTTTSDVTPLTTKGDLFTFDTADARLAVGTNGQTLVADSTASTGLKWASAASSSGPAFKATKTGSNQSVTAATFTKITYDSEEFDTAGNFASSRFTPTTSGYYQFNWTVYGNGSGTLTSMISAIYKNGTKVGDGFLISSSSTSAGSSCADIYYANGSTDYFEIYGRLVLSGGGENFDGGSSAQNRFSGVWIRS